MISSLALSLLVAPNTKYLNAIDAIDLKRHVSYLASDELKGRQTPSEGLDKAADYIAAEFKKSGLKPGNGESFFQETEWKKTGKSVRNVIGIVPGTDKSLAKTYVIVSAHYDHLGEAKVGDDKIFNGANDDASGTAGVLEAAQAIAKTKPKRSVVFITFYGEEKGIVGSLYYCKHPIFPLKDTVANVNLEQIGRTDDSEGARVSALSMTGFEYSDIGATFAKLGQVMGVPVSGHPQYSAAFFGASDNYAFAILGIPAHTLCTAFEFKDYHQVSDHADKIDYENMMKVTKVVAAGTLEIANNPVAPNWSKDNKRVAKFVEASEKLRSGG
jgi:Zn-dependent M28 family amino/carboxypeptidase